MARLQQSRPAVRRPSAAPASRRACRGSTSTTTTLIARCVHHLADLGHRDIALINRSRRAGRRRLRPRRTGRWPASTGPSRERGSGGVRSAAPTTPRPARRASEQILAEHPELTAIATINEAAAAGHPARAGRTRAGSSRGTSPSPGVAAQHWAEDFHPPLTAADVPADEMGAHAVELLLERIAEPAAPPRHSCSRPADLAARHHRPGQGGPLNQTRRDPGPPTRMRKPRRPAERGAAGLAHPFGTSARQAVERPFRGWRTRGSPAVPALVGAAVAGPDLELGAVGGGVAGRRPGTCPRRPR